MKEASNHVTSELDVAALASVPLRSVYIASDQLREYESCLQAAQELQANVIVADAYRGGFSYFASATREEFRLPPLAPQISPSLWEEFVEAVIEHDFLFVARVELLAAGASRAPFPRSPLKRRYREWLLTTTHSKPVAADDAAGSLWLKPWHADVRNYLSLLIAELCEAYPVEGLLVDAWQLPIELEQYTACAESEISPILLPPDPTGEESDLDEALQEAAYAAPFTTAYEQSIARLLRSVRARARRGTTIPLVVLQATSQAWPRASVLVREGYAEGVCITPKDEALAGPTIRKTPGLLWLDLRPAANHSTTEPEVLLPEQATIASGIILGTGTPDTLDSLKHAERKFDEASVPEFSSEVCWEIIRLTAAALLERNSEMLAPALRAFLSQIANQPEFNLKLAPTLNSALKEVDASVEATQRGPSSNDALLVRWRNYVFFFLNYHVNVNGQPC
jgi:hypothetical protein